MKEHIQNLQKSYELSSQQVEDAVNPLEVAALFEKGYPYSVIDANHQIRFWGTGESRMFYEYVKRKWEIGLVSIGLPAVGYGNSNSFEGQGLSALAIKFLSASERNKLVEIAKQDAIAKRDAGSRPKVKRSDLMSRLKGYPYTEISHALEIISESTSDELSLEDVRKVWDRVSVALDHHASAEISDLALLEKELAKAGRFGDS